VRSDEQCLLQKKQPLWHAGAARPPAGRVLAVKMYEKRGG